MLEKNIYERPAYMRQLIGAILAASIFILALILPTPEGLTVVGKKSLALMISAIIIWVFEVMPLAMSCVLLLFLQTIFHIVSLPTALQTFSIPPVFFLFAMFCIVVAFQNSGLTRRIVLWCSLKSRGDPKRLLFLLMIVSALLSTILADVPVVAMMFPVALFLLEQNNCKPGESNFGKAVMIGLPFAASIGGMGTPAGAAPNILTINMLAKTADIHISFFQWSAIGVPLMLLLTPLAWWAVIRVYPPELKSLAGMDVLEREYKNLESLTGREKLYIVLLAINVLMWLTSSLHGIPLAVCAVLGSSLFAIPGISFFDWKTDKNKIGWDIIFLVGAANSLGISIYESGAAAWIANNVLGGLGAFPLVVIMALVATFTVFIHLIVPVNIPLVGVIMPPVVAISASIGLNPAVLAIPLGFCINAAVQLPLDAVPLVTYQGGYYKMGEMFKPGLILSVGWIIGTVVMMYLIATPLGLM